MARITWSVEKNRRLKANADRNICFEDIVAAIENEGLLDDIPHPNTDRYPGQRILVVLCKGYVYGVPYMAQEDGSFFLKTAFPSRLLKRRYIASVDDDKEA